MQGCGSFQVMAKTYKSYLPEQDLLLPPSLREWLPENHLVYCVSDVVDQLDLSAIEALYEEEDRGQPPYHARMMTKILVYGYCVGVFSSRRIQKRLAEDVAFGVLAAGYQPDFRTISDFRKLHLKALEGLFQQVLRLVLEMGALKLGRVALDGSKVKANASKHKAMSYGRMEEAEKRLREEVQELLKQAEAADEGEDKRYGRERPGEELSQELQRRGTPLARRPEEVLTDNGYCSEENLKYLAKRRMEGFVATEKQKHNERSEPCKRGPLPEDASRVERMKRKLKTKVGAAIYARRKCIVEPVFGQIKQARGFRQFLLRGLEKIRGEWALICTTHNLLKFHKICY